MSEQTTYPLAQRFSIGFSAYEDRLLLTTELKEQGPTTVLLTRRMVLLMLKQILNKLPALTGLEQTPVSYWQEVLELTHQKAVDQHKQEAEAEQKASDQPAPMDSGDKGNNQQTEPDSDPKPPGRLFLATELTCQLTNEQLQLAFKGLPVPEAMQTPSAHVPVLALSLDATHVHQVIQLVITQATKAMWHLPVDLPWLEAKADNQPAQTLSH